MLSFGGFRPGKTHIGLFGCTEKLKSLKLDHIIFKSELPAGDASDAFITC